MAFELAFLSIAQTPITTFAEAVECRLLRSFMRQNTPLILPFVRSRYVFFTPVWMAASIHIGTHVDAL